MYVHTILYASVIAMNCCKTNICLHKNSTTFTACFIFQLCLKTHSLFFIYLWNLLKILFFLHNNFFIIFFCFLYIKNTQAAEVWCRRLKWNFYKSTPGKYTYVCMYVGTYEYVCRQKLIVLLSCVENFLSVRMHSGLKARKRRTFHCGLTVQNSILIVLIFWKCCLIILLRSVKYV